MNLYLDKIDWPRVGHKMCWLVTVLALINIVGWLAGARQMIHWGADEAPLQFNTAVGFLLIGGAMILALRRWRPASRILATIALALASVTFLQDVQRSNFGLDQLFFDHFIVEKTPVPGRMAPATAVSFIFCSLSVLVLTLMKRMKNLFIYIQALSVGAILVSVHAFVEQAMRENGATDVVFTDIAPQTVLGFVLLAAGMIVARPKENTAESGTMRVDRYTAWGSVFLAASTFLLWQQLERQEWRERMTETRLALEAVNQNLSSSVVVWGAALRRLAERWDIYGEPPIAQWDRDAAMMLQDYPGLTRIVLADADHIIRRSITRREGQERSGASSEPNGARMTAYRLLPGSRDVRLSSALHLRSGGTEFAYITPVYVGEDLRGYMTAGVHVADLLQLAGSTILEDFSIRVRAEQVVLAESPGAASPEDARLRQTAKLDALGQEWSVEAWPKSEYLDRRRSHLPQSVILFGLMTIGLYVAAFAQTRRSIVTRQDADMLKSRLTATLENMSDAFYLLDRQYCFEYLNTEAQRLLQQSMHDLLGKNVWAVFPGLDRTILKDRYEFVMNSGGPVQFVFFNSHSNSWYSVKAHATADGLAVYFNDITQERAHQEQLRLLEMAVSRQNDLLVITSATSSESDADRKIVYVNDTFVRLMGYSRAEVIGKSPGFLRGPKTDRNELHRMKEGVTAGLSVRAELVNYTKAGEEVWLELELAPIADDMGTHTHWVSVARDITGRKRAEQAMWVSEERFRLLAKATNDVVWDWDFESDKVWWNESLFSVFGYDRDDGAQGPETWVERIHPDDRDRVLAGIYAVIEGRGSNWSDEYRFMHADGHARDVVDCGFLIRDDSGNAVRMLGSIADVTERRRLDERLRQSQKLEAVGQLTGGIAHDFNNLLTVILGNAELLSEQVADQHSLRVLADMTASAAERGAELTNRLLAFARRQALEPKLVDMNRLIAGMEGLLRRTLTEDIDIEIVRAGGLWTTEVDPGQLEAALLNLTINARDAMPEGGRLTVETANAALDEDYARTHQEVVPGQYVMVSVSDSGIGMPPDVMAKAFEPFFTTKEVGKGSGLGLSMVYGFVKQSGGHIKIYSEVGEGTTIRLYFPRAEAENANGAGTTPEARTIGGDEHILVVEDDTMVREHLVAQLKGLGYRVTAANAGPQALEIIRHATDLDLLFTDVVMPGGMNGRQLADSARVILPDLKVLFTSGYSENAIVHHGRLDRGVQLLSKPYRRHEMAAKVRAVLDQAGGDGAD